MKRIYSFIVAALTIISAASCVQELANNSHQQEDAVVYKAIADGADTKAVLGINESGNPQSMWEKGDKITIHNGERGFEFTASSKDHSPVADFVYDGDDFSAENGVVAIYPSGNYAPDFENSRVMVTIPAQQQAVSGSYDRAAVPAVSYSKDNTLSFKNAGALLKFTMNQDNVAKVCFYANGSIIAGVYNAVYDENGHIDYEYITDVSESNVAYVELSVPEGETFMKRTTYYISVMPNDYPGFSIQFMNSAGAVIYQKQYAGHVSVQRNKILNLGLLGNDHWDGAVDKLYLVGSYNQWRHGSNLYLFDYDGNRVTYSGIVDFNAYAQKDESASNEFKFTGGEWGNGEYSQASDSNNESEPDLLYLIEGGGDNIDAYQNYRFYHFTLNKSDCTLTKNYAFNSLGVIGGFNDWLDDVELNFNPDTQNFWTDLDITEDTQLKFRLDHSWNYSFGSNNNSGCLDGEMDIQVSAGQYRLYVNMNNPSRMTYIFDAQAYGTEENAGQWDPWAEEPQPEPVNGWALIGEFNGWNSDAMMTEVQPGQWEIKEFPLEAGQQWKLRKDGSWDVNYGGPGDVEPYEIAVGQTFGAVWYGKNMAVSTSGMYDIYFNENKETILVLAAGSPLPEPVRLDYVDEYGVNHGPGVEIDGVVWAPVNCGYHETDFKYGKLYQWGRKYGQGYNGVLYAGDMSDRVGKYSDSLVPTQESYPVSLNAGQQKLNQNYFYYSSLYPYDWCTVSDNDLWNLGSEDDPKKAEYDPCPSGWRIPTNNELQALIQNHSDFTTNEFGQYGYYFSGNSGYSSEVPQAFLAFAGFSYGRTGSNNHRGSKGYYWSSTPHDYLPYSILTVFSNEGINSGENFRANACSVRCVQDDSELIAVASLTLNTSSLMMQPGTRTPISVSIEPYNANHQFAYWSSSNTSVATVDMNGTVTAVSPGTATITAMAGMKTATCEVTVEYPDLDGTREVTLWRGESMVDNWSPDESNYILSDGGIELLTAGAQPGDMVCFYVEPTEEYWEVGIWEGHWMRTYLSVVSSEYNLADNGGRIILPLTQEILDAAYMQQWFGGTFLLMGDNLKLTKVTLLTSSPDTPSSSYDYVDEYGINHGPGVEIDGVVWAPVNCGYHETDYAYGKLYQWGRKYGQGYDGPLYENGENAGTHSDALAPIIKEGGVSKEEANLICNANVFYYGPSDWVDSYNDKLWNSGTESNPVKTEYDPCPEGWRIPTNAELDELTNNYSELMANSEGQYGRWFSGASQYDESVPRIFLPAAGRLHNKSFADARGDRGVYWSSEPYSNLSSSIIFTSGYARNTGSHNRAWGCSVRCVKDDSESGNGGSQSGDIEDMPEIEL